MTRTSKTLPQKQAHTQSIIAPRNIPGIPRSLTWIPRLELTRRLLQAMRGCTILTVLSRMYLNINDKHSPKRVRI